MKNLAWFVALFAIVYGGDRLFGYFLQKQTDASQFRYSRMYAGEAQADILLVGNSRGLTFFQPYIEEITGKSTFNLSYNGLPMDVAKVLVQDYLDKYKAPKTMIVDITSCDRINDELLTGFLTYAQHSPRLDALIKEKKSDMWWGSKITRLMCYNNEIFQRALSYRSNSDKDWLLDRVISAKLVTDVAKNNYPLDVHEYLVTQLKELVQTAQAKGIEVKLVISPYFPEFEVKNLSALKSAVEAATGLTVSDYRAALTDKSMFGDYMHPNKKGAMRYIDLMKRDTVLP
jgi:hypothetical protein